MYSYVFFTAVIIDRDSPFLFRISVLENEAITDSVALRAR